MGFIPIALMPDATVSLSPSQVCHAEHSEASLVCVQETLRFAQSDTSVID